LYPDILNTGLTIIGKRTVIPADYKIGRNCIVYDTVVEGDLPKSEVKSGETIKPKSKSVRTMA
jgi:UDP-3-O-[3-hydroxymyristoyl] glucosamine N-acyltransferase